MSLQCRELAFEDALEFSLKKVWVEIASPRLFDIPLFNNF